MLRMRTRISRYSQRVRQGRGEEAAPPLFRAVKKTFTVAELNALGAVASGDISIGTEIPAGGVPMAAFARNLGNALTTSVGSVSGLTASIRTRIGAANTVAASTMTTLQTANRRSFTYMNITTSDADDFDVWAAWTPQVAFNLSASGGANMSTLTGLAAGIEVTLVYVLPAVKKITVTITQAQIAAAGAVTAANFSLGTQLPASAFPLAAKFRAGAVLTGIAGPLSCAIVQGSGITVAALPARSAVTTTIVSPTFSTIGAVNASETAGVLDFWSAWTPHVRITSSSGNLSGVTGLGGGIEVELYYAELIDAPNLTHTLTHAEIVAFGSVTSGSLSFGTEVPAGCLPVGWFHKNNGNAGGGVSINLGIGKATENNVCSGDASINSANRRVVAGVSDQDGLTDANLWAAWTPTIRVNGNTGLTNLDAHTGAAAGYDVVFFYYDPTLEAA